MVDAKTPTPDDEKPHRPKQRELDGFEAIKDPQMRDAVHAYVEIHDERMALTAKEVDMRTDLHEMMKKKKIKACSVDDFIVEIVAEAEKVKVRRASGKKNQDEE